VRRRDGIIYPPFGRNTTAASAANEPADHGVNRHRRRPGRSPRGRLGYRPHRHDYDQILLYAAGSGDRRDDVLVLCGQFVLLPADTIHMHGCTDDAPALQISMMIDTTTEFDVDCPIGWERWRDAGRT
jgi:hypothetical protein